VEGAENDAGFEVYHGVAGDGAVVGGFEDAFGGGLDVFFGYDAATDFVDDFLAFAGIGFEDDFGVAVLAASTGLADDSVFGCQII
jgi:hypothetical protein